MKCIISPTSRVTPQVPQNMQEGLQRLELGSGETDKVEEQMSAPRQTSEPTFSQTSDQRLHNGTSFQATQNSAPQNTDDTVMAYQDPESRTQRVDALWRDAPTFSPFPKVTGDNIPPADDAKEDILWSARKHVLHSQNVPMQISWARDVLIWAEIAIDALAREPADRARPATPRIEHELRLDALNIINHLAEQEHPDALYTRSKWLEFGKFGHRIDRREAYSGYKRAAELGHARSEYRMGMLFEQSNDMSKAKEHYYRGMNLQDSAALYRMGMMSLLGQHGESRDYAVSLERIQAAADSSDEDAPQGSYVYGMLVGRDLPDISIPDGLLAFDHTTAKTYVEKAAYLGFAKAQLKMGQAYELCQLGCDLNPSLSLHYYGLAAKQGLPEAALGVSRWFLFGYEGVFKKNEELAFKYAQEAAISKLPTGEFAMGYYYEIGIHVPRNLAEARRWYQLAADDGNQDATDRLTSLNHNHKLSKEDHETTTLTRIKSQHGSQRGKRPERSKQLHNMPTLAEATPDTISPKNAAAFNSHSSNMSLSAADSPLTSPQLSQAINSTGHASFSDPTRAPAFTVRLDGSTRIRSTSVTPYPDDDRPAPLAISRPNSAAPYPEDDVRVPTVPKYGPGFQTHLGPQADRPSSAFGIRAQAGGPRPMPTSHSMGSLQPPNQGGPGQGRVASAGWEPQGPGGGFRQPSPGPGFATQRPVGDDTVPRPYSAQRWPTANATANKLPRQPRPPHSAGLPASPSSGRDHGPRSSSRPSSEASFRHDSRLSSHDYERASRTPDGGSVGSGQFEKTEAKHPPRASTGFSQTSHASNWSSPADVKAHPATVPPSAVVAPAKPAKGPATFEDMGIPQGKQGGDCVSLPIGRESIDQLLNGILYRS